MEDEIIYFLSHAQIDFWEQVIGWIMIFSCLIICEGNHKGEPK